MSDNNKAAEKSVLTIVGGLLLGIGAGLLFFPVSIFGTPSVFAFAGCIVGGLGIGLLLTSMTAAGRRSP
jgi:protein-S-isoprenylcysteine O-methyltransferase Ste14